MIAAFGTLSLLVRVCIAAAIVVSVLGGVHFYNESQRMKGEARVVERSKQKGKDNARKSAKVHQKAREPRAADRLLRDHCRDC